MSIENSEKVSFCTFHLAGRLFGVNILDVKEINSHMRFTPVFHAPKELKGYINIRGHIYLVGDMRQIMGFEKKDMHHNSKMIVFKDSVAESFGIIVDKISDIVTVEKSEIEDRRTEEVSQQIKNKRKSDHNIGLGVCKVDAGVMIALNSALIIDKVKDLKFNWGSEHA